MRLGRLGFDYAFRPFGELGNVQRLSLGPYFSLAVVGDGPRRILIIDDEPAFAASLEKFLLARGYEVDVAADGFEGAKQAREAGYDLVLCDILMPGRDGLEALGEAARSVPVGRWVFLAGASDGDLLARVQATGRPLLRKPVAFHDIEARLGRT